MAVGLVLIVSVPTASGARTCACAGDATVTNETGITAAVTARSLAKDRFKKVRL